MTSHLAVGRDVVSGARMLTGQKLATQYASNSRKLLPTTQISVRIRCSSDSSDSSYSAPRTTTSKGAARRRSSSQSSRQSRYTTSIGDDRSLKSSDGDSDLLVVGAALIAVGAGIWGECER